MAPSFLKDLKRRSKASFMTEKSTDSNASNITVPTSQSSSTVDSTNFFDTNKIPAPSALSSQPSSNNVGGNGHRMRPQMSNSASSNRSSVSGMAGLGSPQSHLPASQYAPRITSISDSAWVCTSLTLTACRKLMIWPGSSEDSQCIWHNRRSIGQGMGRSSHCVSSG